MGSPTQRSHLLLAGTRRSFLLGAAAVGGAGLGQVVLTADGAHAQAAGTPNVADIGFCSDMVAHHVQALAMCQRVLGRDTGDAVQAAAAEVLQNQSIEVGQMRAWLADWGQPTSPPEKVMGWMHDDGYCVLLKAMPGFASDDELRELSLATGRAKGRLWLELMRAHHVGGVHMAERAVELASTDKVIRLAQIQARTQTYEISQYNHLLARTYA